jgi:hypothetical protein
MAFIQPLPVPSNPLPNGLAPSLRACSWRGTLRRTGAAGVAAGDFPAHANPELVARALLEAILFRLLMSPIPFEPHRARALIDAVLGPPTANGPAPCQVPVVSRQIRQVLVTVISKKVELFGTYCARRQASESTFASAGRPTRTCWAPALLLIFLPSRRDFSIR